MKHRAAKFEKFVEENEVKRRRALKKFQMERQQNEVKEKEKEELSKQLQDLQARSPSQTPAESTQVFPSVIVQMCITLFFTRRLCLQERVNKYKKFEEFLMKTLELLPDSKSI